MTCSSPRSSLSPHPVVSLSLTYNGAHLVLAAAQSDNSLSLLAWTNDQLEEVTRDRSATTSRLCSHWSRSMKTMR